MRSLFKPAAAFLLVLGLVVASYCATRSVAAPTAKTSAAPVSSDIHVGGHWTRSNAGGPYAVMNGGRDHAFIAVSKSESSQACEFAIVGDKNGVRFQIIDEKGDYHSIPATSLLKLVEPRVKPPAVGECWYVADTKPKTSDSPAAAKADDGVPAGHRVLYAIARTKAITQLAKKENISRAAAKERIDEISDDALHAAVMASGAITIKAQPVGGKLTDFLDWLVTHQDAILAIVKIILALFTVSADAANSDMFSATDWCGQLFAMAA